jgi:hypothetical protein
VGYILHDGATIACQHPPGLASPLQTDPRVTVSGQAVVTLSSQYTVDGCALSSSTTNFCKQASWLTGAQRVTASSGPVAIDSGSSLCTPSGGVLDPKVFQQRVTAT